MGVVRLDVPSCYAWAGILTFCFSQSMAAFGRIVVEWTGLGTSWTGMDDCDGLRFYVCFQERDVPYRPPLQMGPPLKILSNRYISRSCKTRTL